MKSAEDFWSRKKFADPSTSAAAAVMPEGDRQLDHWLLGRQQRMGEGEKVKEGGNAVDRSRVESNAMQWCFFLWSPTHPHAFYK